MITDERIQRLIDTDREALVALIVEGLPDTAHGSLRSSLLFKSLLEDVWAYARRTARISDLTIWNGIATQTIAELEQMPKRES